MPRPGLQPSHKRYSQRALCACSWAVAPKCLQLLAPWTTRHSSPLRPQYWALFGGGARIHSSLGEPRLTVWKLLLLGINSPGTSGRGVSRGVYKKQLPAVHLSRQHPPCRDKGRLERARESWARKPQSVSSLVVRGSQVTAAPSSASAPLSWPRLCLERAPRAWGAGRPSIRAPGTQARAALTSQFWLPDAVLKCGLYELPTINSPFNWGWLGVGLEKKPCWA